MSSFHKFFSLIAFILILGAANVRQAQESAPPLKPAPSPEPTPAAREEQEQIKIFTEEVRLPVVAYDDYGHYDPTVEPRDLLVLEDKVAQQIRSVRRIPANVLLLLDTSNQITLAKNTKLTRDLALSLITKLRDGDQLSLVEFNNRVALLHDWTTDKDAVARVLKTKLSAGKRARLSEAIMVAAAQLQDMPVGSRHIVLITDGVETPGGKIKYEEAVKQLIAAQATVHVISYTTLIRQAIDQRYRRKLFDFKRNTGQQTEAAPSGDPTMPPGQTRNPSFKLFTIDTDREMRRWFKNYGEATKQSEQRLVSLASETGGRILLPESTENIIGMAEEVARDIGAQYIITYTPQRPLATAAAGEYRRIEVVARRTGLNLRSRRGYIVRPTQ